MRVSLFFASLVACSIVSGTSATNIFASKRTEAPPRAPPSCETTCKDVRSPVCGTNGKTYGNYCLYSIAACKNKTLALAYTTACKTPPKTSDDGDKDNGDGGNTEGDGGKDTNDDSKGATQRPTTKPPVTTAASIADRLAAAMDNEDGDDDEDCDPFCTREYEPVCGSDHVMYDNLCLFDVAKCHAHGNLHVRPKRECKAL